MLLEKEKTKAVAAAKAGMDEKTARKYEKLDKQPSELKKIHDWRTRQDPFETPWEQIKELLEAKTIFEYLQREKLKQ